MRWFFLVVVLLFLSGCRGTEPYSALDLKQVRQSYKILLPTYTAFKHAFKTNDSATIVRLYRVEQRQCHVVDAVDKRDTIDPNVNLFQASIVEDAWCDDIETGYVTWAKERGLPRPKDIHPGKRREMFVDDRKTLKKMRQYMAHPSDLS